MASFTRFLAVCLAVALAPALAAAEDSDQREKTVFQTARPYRPQLDIGADMAIVYGVNESFPERVAGWRDAGYAIGMMTGISWGGYGDYYGSGEDFKREEVQTTKSGKLLMHGNSKNVGYNVPTDTYVEYIKKLMRPAVEAGVQDVFLEEPEFWVNAGWSPAFKAAWQEFYGEPWQAPDSSVNAQYRASRLKYELYFDALRDVFAEVKSLAREAGREIECHVPTHTLINYAHWGIVSPESHLTDLGDLDGYIAQVWTGTARTPNFYGGVHKERTFETAYFEYGQAWAMVRPTGRKLWFLHDPIEDNPNRSWPDYERNYEATVAASLLWPAVHRFEVMPWPNRIFRGKYPKSDPASEAERVTIPGPYATEVLTVINALSDMNQDELTYDAGTEGIGIIVSDTLMFQRAAPHPSDPALSTFYGLSLPLLKHGIPAEVVQLENTVVENSLDRYKVLLLTYEGQKPLKPAYHAALAEWVKAGGGLIYVGDGSDPYHGVEAWWNDEGETEAKAYDDLLERLGISEGAQRAPEAAGAGFVRVAKEKPRGLARGKEGPERVLHLVREMVQAQGGSLETQSYVRLQRGPYVIAAAFDEIPEARPHTIAGRYVDLFDPNLPVKVDPEVTPGNQVLLYDLAWNEGDDAKVLAAAARVKNVQATDKGLRFVLRGPAGTTGRARLALPAEPSTVRTQPEVNVARTWDSASQTALLTFDNQGKDLAFEVVFR